MFKKRKSRKNVGKNFKTNIIYILCCVSNKYMFSVPKMIMCVRE